MHNKNSLPYAVVCGGANIDIGAHSFAPLRDRDSNPGRVELSLGGVGRNIAHNMRLLGVPTYLLTALGGDSRALQIEQSCRELGIDLSHALRVPDGRTSTYVFVGDSDGDMAIAVSDMEIYDHLTPRYLSTKEQLLNNARLVVCDTNIPAETLQWIAENCRAPVFVDPVSTAKAGKVKPVLGKLHTLKPNRIEAELLSGVAITDDKSLSAAADALLATGLHRVFISLGGEGVYAADHLGGRVKVPCGPARMVNTTGCGDAFMAAITWAYLAGTDLTGTAKAGLAASAIAMEGAETINPALNACAVRARAGL